MKGLHVVHGLDNFFVYKNILREIKKKDAGCKM